VLETSVVAQDVDRSSSAGEAFDLEAIREVGRDDLAAGDLLSDPLEGDPGKVGEHDVGSERGELCRRRFPDPRGRSCDRVPITAKS